MIKSGDAKAVKVYEEFNKVAMTVFPQLSNADIDNIIAYTMQPKEEPKAASVAPITGEGSDSGSSNTLILGALALVLSILIFMLFTVNNLLKRLSMQKD